MFMYLRHRHITFLCDRHNLHDTIKSKNVWSSWFGGLGALGITIVGNFQETNVFLVHVIGAFSSFGFGAVWQAMQTWISFKLLPYSGTANLNKIRLFFAVTCVCCFVANSLCGLLAWFQFKGEDATKWKKSDGGFTLHIISTVSEWINAIGFVTFILTFAPEFKSVSFDQPRIRVWEKVTVESAVTSQSVILNGGEFERY